MKKLARLTVTPPCDPLLNRRSAAAEDADKRTEGVEVSAVLWVVVAAMVTVAVFAGVIVEERGRWHV
jgi:hypothetical protein